MGQKDKEYLKDFINYFSSRKNKKTNIEDFIENHKHIRYCEAIIYPDGRIGYVNPSHLYSMMREIHPDTNVVYEMMPVCEIPLYWSVNKSQCIAIWYDGYIIPNDPTEKSLETFNILKESNVIDKEKFKSFKNL